METPFDQKINVVYLDESRRTPVHCAALDGKHEQVEEKVRVASGLDDQDEQERTPLHHATEHGHRKVCHTLLQHGANSSVKDREHWTPLMSASDLGKEQSCQDILTVNPETDDVNMDEETALHIACRRGHVGVVNLLMDYGASLNVCNKDGVTCFETAAKSGKSEVVFAMIKHKRWMEIMEHKDKKGLTPMKLLIKHFPESAQLVMDYCIDRSGTESSDDPNFTVTCNLRFLDPSPTDTTYLRESRFFGPSTMVKHERRELLDHPLTQVLLNKKWSSFGRLVFFFNFMFYFVFVVMITAFLIRFMQNGDKELGDYFIYVYPIAFLLIGVQFTKEVIVILVQRLQYFTTLSNLTEWLLYSTTTSFMVSLFIFDLIFSLSGRDKRDIVYPQFIWMLGAISIFLCYANLVLVLRRLSLVGIYVTMFIEVTKSVLKVLLIFFVLFFGFSMVFYVLFKSEESVFKHLGFALLKVTVMTIGEVDFEGRFMRSQNITNEQTVSQTASFVFLGLFLILMTIVLMNLLVGLAVGDIDAIRRNAAFKRMAMKVMYIAKVENSFPRCISRRFRHPEVTLQPNRRTLRKRLMLLLGMKTSSGLDFTPRAKEEPSPAVVLDYTEIKKKLDLTEKRVETLVDTMEAQNALLRELVKKIDPGTKMNEKSMEMEGPTVEQEYGSTSASGEKWILDDQQPHEIKTQPHLYNCGKITNV